MPRRPFNPYPPYQQTRPRRNQNVFHYFMKDAGGIDFTKIDLTARQMMKVYGQVSPYLTKFFNR